jgi:hypothetical protein
MVVALAQVFMGIAIIHTFVPAPIIPIDSIVGVLFRWLYPAYVAMLFVTVVILEYK